MIQCHLSSEWLEQIVDMPAVASYRRRKVVLNDSRL